MIVDYTDSDGILRRVRIPDSGAFDLTEGIPVSLPVDQLYMHMPIEFRRELVNTLWEMGFIEPRTFLNPGAAERIRAVILSIVKHDVFDIMSLAREYTDGD